MTEMQKRRLREYGVSALYGVVVSLMFTLLTGQTGFLPICFGGFIGVAIGVSMTTLHLVIAPRLRRLPFLFALVGMAVCYLLVIGAAFFLSVWLFVLARNGVRGFEPEAFRLVFRLMDQFGMQTGFSWAVGVTLVATFFGQLSRKLGPGVLTGWLLGRYRQPRGEERIFMFLDLRASTALAEQLGDLRFSALIRDFFADLTAPILETRGEVSHFIGDEVVLCWTMKNGLKTANCLRCFFRAQAAIAARRGYYERVYGVTPEFKAGLHCGGVIVTEVGEIKSEIVFHGDVLNTASRIQSLCNELDSNLLLSAELARRLPPSAPIRLDCAGDFHLKGKEQPLTLYRASEGKFSAAEADCAAPA